MTTRSLLLARHSFPSLMFVLLLAPIYAAHAADSDVLDRVNAVLELESNDDVSITPTEIVEWLSAGLEMERAQIASAQIAEIHYRRGIALILLGERTRAKEDLRKTLELNSYNNTARLRLAILLDREGEKEAAQKLIAEMLELHPTPYQAWIASSTISMNRGDWRQCIDWSTKAIDLHGELPRPYWLRSHARYEEAMELAGHLLGRDGEQKRLLLRAALDDINLYFERERIWGDELPIEKEAFRHRADILLALGKPRESMSDLVISQMISASARASDVDSFYSLNQAYGRRGKYYAALAIAKKSVASCPNESYSHYMLGLALQSLRRYDDSLAPLLAAAKLDREDDYIGAALAETYFVLGNDELALATCRDILERNGDWRLPRTIAILIQCGSPNPTLRDGSQAARLAWAERSKRPDGLNDFLLGAAQSECGAFDTAVKSAGYFRFDKSSHEVSISYHEKWIKAFQAHKPFRLGGRDERIDLMRWTTSELTTFWAFSGEDLRR